MKRTIIIEIFLVVVLAISIHFNYCFWNSVSDLNKLIEMYTNSAAYDYTMVIQELKESVKTNTNYAILSLTSSLLILASIILIAIKDLSIFKTILEKATIRKQVRIEAKKQRQLEDKQQKLEQLQAEIDNLTDN